MFLYSMGIGVATIPLIKESKLGSKYCAANDFTVVFSNYLEGHRQQETQSLIYR